MALFDFIAVPLIKLERGPYGTSRELEIMGGTSIRRQFPAKDIAEVHQRLDEICAEIGTDTGKSWHAWVTVAKGNRAPNGFNKAKDSKAFNRDINPDRVTVGAKAA